MSRFRTILGMLALALVATFGLASPASAAENMGRVRNYAGEPVAVRCDYGSSSTYFLIEKYPSNPKANSTYWCGSLGGDTDQFKAPNHYRCMTYTGPGYTDGEYKLAPGTWQAVDGLALVRVYPWGGCGNRAYFNKKN